MSDDLALARTAIAGVPFLKGYAGPIVRLGGLTNLVFQAGDFCIRVPGKGTEEYINRANEAVAAREAAKADVSPEVLYFDEKGVMVTRFVDGAQTMSPAAFKLNEGAPARAGEAFRKLHTSGAVFPFRFYLFSMIDDYLKILSTKDVVLPKGYHDVHTRGRGNPHRAVAASREARRLPLRSALREFSGYGRAHVDRRLGIFGDERPDVGSRRPLGRGQVRRTPGGGDAHAPISPASRGRPSAGAS